MMGTMFQLVLIVYVLSGLADGNHYRGGIISWRPMNATPSGLTAQILLRQVYFWNRVWGSFPTPYCTEADVAAQTLIPVGVPLACYQNCTSSNYATISTQVVTTDCLPNPIIVTWAGERFTLLTLTLTTSITIGFTSSAWIPLYNGLGNGLWSIMNRLNLGLRPDGFINSSPVTNTLPVIFYQRNVATVHIVQMADNDAGDILKCRWATSVGATNYNRQDECGTACSGLPAGTVLTATNCTLSFILPLANTYYGCSLQIEDYYNAAATNPLSSVPIQFLFYAYNTSGGACGTRPSIIGVRPNRACIGIPYGVQLNETIVVQTYCPGQTIVDFVTSSPTGMSHSTITKIATNQYTMVLTWTPIVTQVGPQGFCAAALDNSTLQSDPWCLTYLVGYASPNLITPTLVQGSASPVGTVFQNHSVFSIQATSMVGRPTRNGTKICFNQEITNISVLCYDAGYAPNIIYTGYTIIIITNYTWAAGQFYYVTTDSGFASGSEFCHAESAALSDPTFWRYNIWNPALSSTTTTTTTPMTTATGVTKPTSTTSINTALTTTGIVITTTAAVTTASTTTTAAPATTAAPTTAGPTAAGSTTESTVDVTYPKDLEEACKQALALMIPLVYVILAPGYTIALYAGFVKYAKMFKPANVNAKTRHKQRMKRILH